ncbi:ras-related protein Rab-24-like [Clavelina lepadiformis]|uniref:ras-related protein Rab-24-like n=1 Tax=Clavelina lepadiformis TaxID=159417 RepID=UPI0040420F80
MGIDNNRVDCKVVLLGKEYGGKTSLLERFLHEQFNEASPYQSTIGAAFGAKRVAVNDKFVILGIWDTAGSERYQAMSRLYYRDAKAAIVCYDVTEQTSFQRARFWIDELLQNEENCKVYLAGTKIDLVQSHTKPRSVDLHDVCDYGEAIKAAVLETSSKTGENVNDLFLKIAFDFTKDPYNFEKLEDAICDASVVNVSKADNNRKNCCHR